MIEHIHARATRVAGAAIAALCIAACAGGVKLGPDAVAGKRPDANVEMHEVQAAYIGSGSAGAGSINYGGRVYKFKVGGVGIGGIGLSTIDAHGEVYDLHDLAQFPGVSVRRATALPSATRARAISGSRTKPV